MLKISFLYGLITIFIFSFSYAQNAEMQFERISIESGLSQSSVLCICQDTMGFLWFGTYTGLNRYDGYNFKIYKNEPDNPKSISKHNIQTIIEDHLGILWIGTEGGLERFDREAESFFHYKNIPGDTSSLSFNYVRCIYEDRSGTIWVGTQGGGLNRLDRKNGKFTRYMNDPNNLHSLSQNNVLSILEDRQGQLWIGTDNGLNNLNRQDGKFVRYLNDPRDPNSVPSTGIIRVIEDDLGNLWLGSWGNGLCIFDRQKHKCIYYQNERNNPYSLSDNIIRSIYSDHNGILWIGTNGGGLNKFVPGSNPKERGRFIRYQNDALDPRSLSGNCVLSIYEDKNNILWIGTDHNGINKYNQNKRQFALYKNQPNNLNSLSKGTVFAVCEDKDGIMWIGTGGGLNRLDRKNNLFTRYINNPKDPHSLSNNGVRSVYIDHNNRLWVGTEDGLNYFDRKNGKFTCFKNNPADPRSLSNNVVFSIYEDRRGNLWIGTFGGGLNRFDYSKKEFTRYVYDPNNPRSIRDNSIWTINEDSSGALWIGTFMAGLARFDPVNGEFFHYTSNDSNSNSVSDNNVLCLFEGRDNILWFGTTNGLNKYDRNAQRFYFYTEKNGLPNNNVQAILEDNSGNLWISTNYGLSKFDPREITFTNYFESYGLQSNEFSPNACCMLKSGEMAFGGMQGFNVFNPGIIRYDQSLPKVIVTDFQIFNKPVPIGENEEGRIILKKSILITPEIHLSYKDNVFSFEFAALHYTSPKDNLYAYMMEGFEKDWNYTDAKRRFISYTNLPSGTYRFRVKGSNNNGIWNEKSTDIQIEIVPPFWQTIWFRLLLLAPFIGAVFLIYRWQIQAKDFAAQKRLDAALTKERNLLRTMINNIPDPVYAKDTAGRKTIANLADIQNLGFSNDAEVLGKDDYAFFAKDIAEKFISDDKSVIEKGVSVINKEEYFKQANGDERWLLTTKIPLRNEENEIIGLVGVGRDITKWKKYEEYLQNERNLLRTLIDNLPDYIYIKDNKGQFLVANTAVASQLGFKSPDELIGKSDHDLFPYELASQYFATEQKILTSGEGIFDYEGPTIDISKEEKERWITTTKVPLYNAKGEIAGTIGLGRDITERRKIAAEREKLITQLQEAVADVKLLSGLVPICANCKKIRDDQGYWTQIESYIQDRSNAKFSHSICPECAKKLYPNYDIKI